MALDTYIGPRGNLLIEDASAAELVHLPSVVITEGQLNALAGLDQGKLRGTKLSTLFAQGEPESLATALESRQYLKGAVAGPATLGLGPFLRPAFEQLLDVRRVVAPVAALADPDRAEVARLLPAANCRDVDPEQVRNLTNAKERIGTAHRSTPWQNCTQLGNRQRTVRRQDLENSNSIDNEAKVGRCRRRGRTPEVGDPRLPATLLGSLPQETLDPRLGQLVGQPPGGRLG